MVDYDVVALHHSALGNVQLLLSAESIAAQHLSSQLEQSKLKKWKLKKKYDLSEISNKDRRILAPLDAHKSI